MNPEDSNLSRLKYRDGVESALLASAERDAPLPGRREEATGRVLSEYRRARAQRRSLIQLGIGMAVATGALGVLIGSMRQPALEVSADRSVAGNTLPSAPMDLARSAAAPSASALPESSPNAACAPAVVALGTSPLIDDFEDGDSRILLSEKRAGDWLVFNDGTAQQQPRAGTSFRAHHIPGGRDGSHFGLHVRGGKFAKWGAVVAATLNPHHCYDASVYAGLTFWARGRGRIRIAAKMTQVVTEEFGGTCVDKCFDLHAVSRPLNNTWSRVTVRWEELSQSGHGQPIPFDPASLYSIDFVMPPEQSPFDFWIDDVSFLPKAVETQLAPMPPPPEH